MSRTWGWMLLGLLALAPAAQAQSLDQARGFVGGLYRAYGRPSAPDYLGGRAATVFSPRLLALIRRDERNAHGEVGALDGDPICNCQDPDGLRLLGLEVEGAGRARAVARVRIDFGRGEPEDITLDLVSVAGRWRVDNVHTADMPSLAGLLGGRPGR